MQSDIPVQTNPPETAVTAALRTLARIAGWCVTHTTDGGHAQSSLHYCGRAVDLAARSGPGSDTSQLLAINEQVIQLLPLSMISELIYAGPGAICVKNGRVVSGAAVYGVAVLAEHHNHVHLGVIPGFTYNAPLPPKVVVVPQYDPPLPVVAWLNNPNGPGGWGLGPDGGLFALGGAPFTGSAAGKPYFAGRAGAQLKLSPDGKPIIIATSGESYGPTF